MNKPELVATATNVASMYHDSGRDPDIIRPVLTSTTFSASIVAGAAALILEACPDYIDDPIELGRLLLETANGPIENEFLDCGSGWQNPLYYADGRDFDNSVGYGSLDVKAAIDRCIPKKKRGKKSSRGKKSDDDVFD